MNSIKSLKRACAGPQRPSATGIISKGPAFTLIELLIVIAIIAILALIAIPNFLEAQVRAKVSRAKADMRALATAIEAYTVDYHRPMLGKNALYETGCTGGLDYRAITVNGREANWITMSFLTTPVAYLSSILFDPFADKGAIDDSGDRMDFREIYQCQTWLCPALSASNHRCYTEWGYTWTVHSPGPSRSGAGNVNQILRGMGTRYAYDPSNGTVSHGFIIRTNKGPFTAPGR